MKTGAGLLQIRAKASAPYTDPLAPYRDLAAWPFAADDPFNIGLGASATWSTGSSSADTNLQALALSVAPDAYTIPVFQARATDPVENMGASSVTRIPATAESASGTDHHLVIFSPKGAGGEVAGYSYYGANKRGFAPPNSWSLSYPGLGSGPWPMSGYSNAANMWGGRAARIFAAAGLIRADELLAGVIPHALAAVLGQAAAKPGFVWPALAEDGVTTGYLGNIPLGSVIGIPSAVNLASLGLSADGLTVATALQKYGMVMFDTTSNPTLNIQFQTVPRSANGPAYTTARTAVSGDLATIRPYLRVLTNQQTSQAALTSAGAFGGGARLAPAVPNHA